jgi:hypothetical protein
METTKNKLPENINLFFEKLKNYLDAELYFYGSVQRNDYFHGSSDIDVDIFTYNIHSTISKMQHFLNVDKNEFKKFIWRLNHNNIMVKGYKIMYKNEEENFKVEFSIYDENDKIPILYEHKQKIIIPFYISWLLVLLKFVYYKMKVIDKKSFHYLKRKLLNFGYKDDDFLVL